VSALQKDHQEQKSAHDKEVEIADATIASLKGMICYMFDWLMNTADQRQLEHETEQELRNIQENAESRESNENERFMRRVCNYIMLIYIVFCYLQEIILVSN